RALHSSNVHVGLWPEVGSPDLRRARDRPGSARGTARHATSAKWWGRKPIATRSQNSVGRAVPAGASSAKWWVREPIATTSQTSAGRGPGAVGRGPGAGGRGAAPHSSPPPGLSLGTRRPRLLAAHLPRFWRDREQR